MDRVRLDLRLAKFQGCAYSEIQDLPRDVYDILVEMVTTDAEEP